MKRILKRLDATRQNLLDTVSPLPPQLFSQRPADTEWSVAEIVHHLHLVEELVIRQMEKELQKPPQQIGMLRKLIPVSIVSLRLTRVKAPKAATPLEPPAKDENIAELNSTRAKLKELCTKQGEARLKKIIFMHPVLGQIDGTQTVSFVGYHELRHYKQIRDVLKRLSKVGSAAG